MTENSFEAQYNITKKSKLLKFYESNKIFIFSFIFILVILFGTFSFYLESKEKKRFYYQKIICKLKFILKAEIETKR